MEDNLEDWKVSCSDDEGYGGRSDKDGKWEPPIDQVIMFYQRLQENGSLELKWSCPGRRSPSLESESQLGSERKSSNASTSDTTKASTEFDFDEEFADSVSNPTTKLSASRRKNSSKYLFS